MMDLFYKIIDVQDHTLHIIIGVCIIAAILKREILGGVWFVAGMVPIYVLASLTSMYFFRKYQLVAVSDKEIEAVIVSAVGVTIVFLCYLICLDVFRSVTAWNVKRMIKKRNLIGADRSNQA